MPRDGRAAIPSPSGSHERAAADLARVGADPGLDLERLERAVQALAERCSALRDENAKLASGVAERDERIAGLEGEVRRLHQTRRDIAKRIGDLIAQIDQLEGRLVARAE